MRWEGHVGRMVERRSVYRIFVGKPEGKRPFGSPRRRWEDNIKMDLQEVGCEGGGMEALVNAIIKLGLHKMRGIS